MVDLLGLGLLIVGLALIVAELTFPGYYIGVAGTVGLVVGLLEMVWPTFLTSPACGPSDPTRSKAASKSKESCGARTAWTPSAPALTSSSTRSARPMSS